MVTDFLLYFIHLITAHPFGYAGVFVIISLVFGSRTLRTRNKYAGSLFTIGFIFIFINFFAGSFINVSLIHRFGDKAEAKITGSYSTSTQYNNHDVIGYHMLLKTREGKVITTSFEDDDFNVYPSHNSTIYPREGDSFNVSYISHFPSAFVIISDDDSPWAMQLACDKLHNRLIEAQRKYNFDRSNISFRKEYINMIQSVIRNHCYTDSLDLQKYYGDMDYVRQGKAL